MSTDATVRDITPLNQQVCFVSAVASVSDTIKTLFERGILSAPVVGERLGGGGPETLGFVDMLDIVTYVLMAYTEEKGTFEGTHFRIWCQNLKTLHYRGKLFAEHPIRDCINMSGINPFCSVAPSAKLKHLLHVFTKGLHRVAVREDSSISEVVGVVTQSDVMRYVAHNPHLYQPVAYKTMADLGLIGGKSVATISDESRAVHGFHHMTQARVSAVAVVDRAGVLQSTLSASDLKCLREENFPDLLLPVEEYLKKNVPHRKAVPRVEASTTFGECMTFLSATGVHRLWIVDDFRRPVGVMALTDMMRVLLENVVAAT